MEKLFEMLGENPIWIVVIILAVVCIIVSSTKKKNPQQNNGNGTSVGGNGTAGVNTENSNIGDMDKTEVVFGYYRYQDDDQIVIKRTNEQQRIFEEYFVVKNIKTTICESALKKKAKTLKIVFHILLWPGIILGAIGFFGDKTELGAIATGQNIEAIVFKTALGVIGVLAVIAAIVCKIWSSQTMKKFNASIKVSVAPKKLMTDEEFEQLVDAKIEAMNIAQLGLDKLGLDPDQVKEIHPIVLRDKVIDETSLTVRNKEDHSVHSSTQHVTYLYFTDEQLFVYKIQFDMCCNMQEEWASEFFYKDICDVSSYTSRNVLKADDLEFEYSTISFNIIASNSQIGFDLDGDNENVGSIQAMKQKIREKKAQ